MPYIPDRNGKQQEKDPEIEVKPLAGGPTLAGHPERKEPEQSRSIKRDCHVSLYVELISWIPTTGENMSDTREINNAMILGGFTPPSPKIPLRRSCPSMHFVANKSKTANNGTVEKLSGR